MIPDVTKKSTESGHLGIDARTIFLYQKRLTNKCFSTYSDIARKNIRMIMAIEMKMIFQAAFVVDLSPEKCFASSIFHAFVKTDEGVIGLESLKTKEKEISNSEIISFSNLSPGITILC